MQLNAVRIIVDRPFLLSQSGTSVLAGNEIDKSRESCNGAAFNITKLLQIFRRRYSLRRVNIQAVHLIFTAMLVHVHNACLSEDYEVCETARRHLEICSQALGEIGQAYKNALRALEVITSIKSDLLINQRRLMNPSVGMMGQPTFLNSTVALGQVPSALPLPSSDSSYARPTGDFYGETLYGIDWLRGMGLETQPASLSGQMVLSEQWPWTSFNTPVTTSNAEENLI